MKKAYSVFALIAMLLISCTPQVTVTLTPAIAKTQIIISSPTFTVTPTVETMIVAGGLKLELGKADENGNAIIEKLIPPEGLGGEDLDKWEGQWDETKLGLEGDWVKTTDGRVVLLDDLSNPESILAEYKLFEQIRKMEVVVDGSKLTPSDEEGLLSVGLLWDTVNGLPVKIDEARESTWSMHQDYVLPILKEIGMYATTVSGDIYNSDRSKELIVRYTVFNGDSSPGKEATEQSRSGMITFRTSSGVITVFVDNFILTPEK